MAIARVKIDFSNLHIKQEPKITDCQTLSFTTANPFLANSLEVFLDGRQLTNILDYTVGGDLQSFTLIVDPSDKQRLDNPPTDSEELRVNYLNSNAC